MANFSFTQLSPSSGPYTYYAGPAINDAGTATFEAFFAPQSPPAAILTGSGGPTTVIADPSTSFIASSGTPTRNITFQPDINNSGTTSFAATVLKADFSGRLYNGVFNSSSGQLTTLANNNTAAFDTFGLTSINNVGTTAFYATLDTRETSIFTSSGGQIATLADTSDIFSDFRASFSSVATGRGEGPFSGYSLNSINNEGTVAFTASLDAGGTGIFTGSGGETTKIADSSSDLFKAFSSVSINKKGTVAFFAEKDTGGYGIFTSSDGAITTLADTNSSLFDSFQSDPAINDLGTVAIVEKPDNGVTGIFTGSEPVADKVIAVGDEFFGSTVTDVAMSQEGLNNVGQIAFRAQLADGRQGIFRAEPVPEPGEGIVSVLALGILFVLGQRWRRRMQSPKHARH